MAWFSTTIKQTKKLKIFSSYCSKDNWGFYKDFHNFAASHVYCFPINIRRSHSVNRKLYITFDTCGQIKKSLENISDKINLLLYTPRYENPIVKTKPKWGLIMPETGKRKSEKYPHSQHCLNIFNRVLKLYGVGPVDNKPSTNKLHNFVIIIIFSSSSNCDMWHVICDMWHMKCDMWLMKCDMLGGVSFLTLLTVMEKDMFFYTTIVWAKIYLPKKGVNRPKNTSCTKQTPLNYQNYLQVPQKFPKKWKAQDNTVCLEKQIYAI